MPKILDCARYGWLVQLPDAGYIWCRSVEEARFVAEYYPSPQITP